MHFDPHCWVHGFLTNLIIHNPICNTVTESKLQPCVCVHLVGNRVSLIIFLCPLHSSGLWNKQGFSTHNPLLSIQRALRGKRLEMSSSRISHSLHHPTTHTGFCSVISDWPWQRCLYCDPGSLFGFVVPFCMSFFKHCSVQDKSYT